MLLNKFFKFAFAFTILFLPSKVNCQDCGQLGTGNRSMTVGKNPTDGEWPWMVAITFEESPGDYHLYCTGFLINRKHVLTAAHCFDANGDGHGHYATRIGKVNLNKGKTYSIARVSVHDEYKPGTFYHDIAILTLDREVNIRNFNPVCLPDAELSRKDLTDFGTTLVGWGSNKPFGPISNYQQQLSGLRIMSNRGCNEAYREVAGSHYRHQFPRGINGEFICANIPDGRDACGFTSGGPLMYHERERWFAVGILSFAYSCGHPEIPGGYIRISNYLDWISDNTKESKTTTEIS